MKLSLICTCPLLLNVLLVLCNKHNVIVLHNRCPFCEYKSYVIATPIYLVLLKKCPLLHNIYYGLHNMLVALLNLSCILYAICTFSILANPPPLYPPTLSFTTISSTVNTRQSAAICFQRIWRINKFGRLTGYSLVLVHYIGTGKLWRIKRFGR